MSMSTYDDGENVESAHAPIYEGPTFTNWSVYSDFDLQGSIC